MYRINLTHWGRVTHICVSKLTIIGSDSGLSTARRQNVIWAGSGILSMGPVAKNFSEILIEIYIFLLRKMPFKMSSAKWLPCWIGFNVSSVETTVITRALNLDYLLQEIIISPLFDTKIPISKMYTEKKSQTHIISYRVYACIHVHIFNLCLYIHTRKSLK